jgi:hypothetical protein
MQTENKERRRYASAAELRPVLVADSRLALRPGFGLPCPGTNPVAQSEEANMAILLEETPPRWKQTQRPTRRPG